MLKKNARNSKQSWLKYKSKLKLRRLSNYRFLYYIIGHNDIKPNQCVYCKMPEKLYVVFRYQNEWYLINICYISRQRDNLNKTMSAKGYEEKVPSHVKEENVSKLATLMQQLLSIEEAADHIEREVASKAQFCFWN